MPLPRASHTDYISVRKKKREQVRGGKKCNQQNASSITLKTLEVLFEEPALVY